MVYDEVGAWSGRAQRGTRTLVPEPEQRGRQ
jgi:hypothetical protein